MTINRYTMGEAKLLYANDKEIVPAHEYDSIAAELADASAAIVVWQTHVQGHRDRIRELEAALERMHMNDRLCIESIAGGGIRVCQGYHHRSADCEWIEYFPRTALETEPKHGSD